MRDIKYPTLTIILPLVFLCSSFAQEPKGAVEPGFPCDDLVQFYKVAQDTGTYLWTGKARDKTPTVKIATDARVYVAKTAYRGLGYDNKWASAFYGGIKGDVYVPHLKKEENDIDVFIEYGPAGKIIGTKQEYWGVYLLQSTSDDFDFYVTKKIVGNVKVDNRWPAFIFDGFEPNPKSRLTGVSPGFIYPGDGFSVSTKKFHYSIHAVGDSDCQHDSTKVHVVCNIKEYEVHIQTNFKGNILGEYVFYKKSSVGYSHTLSRHGHISEEIAYGYYIKWAGDIDGDGKLDLVIRNMEHHECHDVILYLSSKAIKGCELRKVVHYTTCSDLPEVP